MKTVRYYLSPRSPWTYLGHERLLALAKKNNAVVEPRPFGLGESVMPISGGLPLNKRAPQRQAYRLLELQRWSKYLGLPLNLNPKFFPVDEVPASKMIVATIKSDGNEAALKLAGALLRAVWVEERDIADADTLVRIGDENGLDGSALYGAREEAGELYELYTNDAIALQVFGAPWYEYRGISYWGQDRLDFLERALVQE